MHPTIHAGMRNGRTTHDAGDHPILRHHRPLAWLPIAVALSRSWLYTPLHVCIAATCDDRADATRRRGIACLVPIADLVRSAISRDKSWESRSHWLTRYIDIRAKSENYVDTPRAPPGNSPRVCMHAAVRYGKIYTASIAVFKSVALESLMIWDL